MASPGPQRYPASRPGVEFVIRDAFTRARAYQRGWQDYDRRKKAGEKVDAPRRDRAPVPRHTIVVGKCPENIPLPIDRVIDLRFLSICYLPALTPDLHTLDFERLILLG